MPARGKTVFSHLIFFLTTVERTAVAARHASPGTGQEGHGRAHVLAMERGESLAAIHSCAFSSLFVKP
jgi:hypothetical protein